MKKCTTHQHGFTILELTVAVSLFAVISGVAAVSLSEMSNPARHGAVAIASYIEMARAQAISSTSTIIVRPISTGEIQGYAATDCSDVTPTADSELLIILSDKYSLDSLGWELCFSPRGFASTSDSISLTDIYGEGETVEVFVGGGVRIS